MPSEANKIREQCRQAAAKREKALRERISYLETELHAKEALLADYKDMKNLCTKLIVFCGLNEEDRKRVLRSKEIEDIVDKFAGFFGIVGSTELRKLAGEVFKGDSFVPIEKLLEEAEKRWGS